MPWLTKKPGRSTILAPMLILGLVSRAVAAECPGHSDALGTSRVLTLDAKSAPRVGHKQFPVTLPLAAHEVVLTFDDGPWPGTTARVLDALAAQCAKATFFLLGRNALAHPELVRRERAEGHTIAYHTFSHPWLDHLSTAAAEAEIDHGIETVDRSLGGLTAQSGVRLFRFPGFASTPALLDRLERRHIVVFGADLWASDWNPMKPEQELRLVLARLEAAGRGIILFHDTKAQTAAMLPAFLRELKLRNYRLVHVVVGN